MNAKDIMTVNVVTVGPDEPVTGIARLLIERGISAVPVVDTDGTLKGIVSEGDLVHRVSSEGDRPRSWWLQLVGDPNETPQEYLKAHGQKAADVMTSNVKTVSPQTSVADVAEMLEKNKIKRVPVVEGKKLVGIISRANILQALVAGAGAQLPKIATNDQEIRVKLLEEIGGHELANTATINVTVNEGNVQLWGFVDTEDARKAVQLAAENIAGVKSVEDNLSIMPKYSSYA